MLTELPLWLWWLRRAAWFWNRLLAQPSGSMLWRALDLSILLALEARAGQQLAWQSWVAQLATWLAAVGMPLDLQSPAAVGRAALQRAALQHHLEALSEAATRAEASKLRHYMYVQLVRGGCSEAESYAQLSMHICFTYVKTVQKEQRQEALAQLRTGSHWLAEETGRWSRLSREQRVCPHCDQWS